jgi:hypothetical protein
MVLISNSLSETATHKHKFIGNRRLKRKIIPEEPKTKKAM